MEPQDRQSPNLHDLPPELFDQIMFFLPLKSILRLMVNRTLRSACEQYLYRKIWIIDQPYRSLRLLNTLALRPDLALAIRELYIHLEWCHPRVIDTYKLPGLLQPDGLAPLASARNIRTLYIGGLEWLSDPALANIRGVISQMELTSLTIADGDRNPAGGDPAASQMVISNLRAILQSQPQLEFLCLASDNVKAALLDGIEVADVPNLNHFYGQTRFAEAFLNAAPKLDKLDLSFDFNGLAYTPLGKTWNGHKIRRLAISTDLTLVNWDHCGRLLERFPNTESLRITCSPMFRVDPLLFLLERISLHLRALPLLRKLEINGSGVMLVRSDLGPTAKALLAFKEYCPSLEHFIDPDSGQWVYTPSVEDGRTFQVKLECQLERKWFTHPSDLPTLKWHA